ncbi:hypothetical protein [Shewanella sp. GXUN23E]|uniref:hypothetical protein n=1 Tax=Shewanella sp. GXUN23E TaxID=3422498 RepID=UPI003D7C4287
MKFKYVLVAIGLVSQAAMADEAERAFATELLDCSAYYQIASEAVASMNSPQMASVASRLSSQAEESKALAATYLPADELIQALDAARQKQILSMKDAKDLAGLMATHKEQCKSILADPKARLEYWAMATM